MTAVEYALYVFFVALAMFLAIAALNGAIASVLTSTADDPTISGPPPAGPDDCADVDDDACDTDGDDDGDDDQDDGENGGD